MSGEVKFFIKRDDDTYYAGTTDKKALWTERKNTAAPFPTRDQAEQRTAGLTLTSDASYEIESGALPVRKAEEVRVSEMAPGDCFEDEYETGYTWVGYTDKDGERMIEATTKFNGEPMLWYPDNQVYKITYD